MPRLKLEEIFEDKLIGDVAPLPICNSEEDRILQGFEEINKFIDRHGHKPGEGSENPTVTEKSFQFKLKGLVGNPDVAELLAPHDRHDLLDGSVAPAPTSLDEILDSDDELLTTPSDDIFTIRHVSAPNAKPDWVSSRKKCEDFKTFKPALESCAKDLETGRRKTRPFKNGQQIKVGEFFILNGVMVFVAEINDPHIRYNRKNARLRLIFDNGTEGNNLHRSFSRKLYEDPNGRRVTEPIAGPLFDKKVTVDSDLKQTGMIYVVRSLSPDSEISKLDGQLFKIGVTTGSAEDRIRAAKDDPTYLMAPVHPVCTFTLMNADPAKVEKLIHRFFADARLDIEITDRFGKAIKPREWFLVPLPLIEQAIKLLMDGSIVKHRYDPHAGEIVPVSN